MKTVNGLFGLFFILTINNVAADHASTLDNNLVKSLQQGGYVIYFRHAESNHDKIRKAPVDINDCDLQRSLSNNGRKQATEIGKAIAALNIPLRSIISSPYCRTVETAVLAFNRAETDELLASSFTLKKQERELAAAHLLRLLKTAPKSGTNTIIIGHSANIRNATGDWPKPEGTMLIYMLTEANDLELIADIKPDDWVNFIHE